jgi:hypothetical protein
MKKVIADKEKANKIYLSELHEKVPIFAKNKHGELAGMLIQEPSTYPNGEKWILKLGGKLGATGYHSTRQECIDSCTHYGYEFYVDL